MKFYNALILLIEKMKTTTMKAKMNICSISIT